MSLLSPLNKVLGLGSADKGTGHWWAQRLTAVVLIPLTIWFAVALLGRPVGSHADIAAWIAAPLNSFLLILLVIILAYHSSLGLQVVIEDYVHGATKTAALVAVKLAHVALALVGLYAVVAVTFGSRL